MGHKKKKAKVEALADGVPGLICTGYLKDVNESSGLALTSEPGLFYTHGDHGNDPILYTINWQGEVVSQLRVPGAVNNDWEGLTRDNQGRIYIGDFGNNRNDRRDLTIYRFDPAHPDTEPARIFFLYADQHEFPPADKADYNFDCEGMVWREGMLYLFTRDRGRHRLCRVYALSAQPGTAVAQPIGEYELPAEVTDAALSPDNTHLALLSQQQLFLVTITPESLVGGSVRVIPLPGVSHAEGVVFTDRYTLAITTERGGMYQLILPHAVVTDLKPESATESAAEAA